MAHRTGIGERTQHEAGRDTLIGGLIGGRGDHRGAVGDRHREAGGAGVVTIVDAHRDRVGAVLAERVGLGGRSTGSRRELVSGVLSPQLTSRSRGCRHQDR